MILKNFPRVIYTYSDVHQSYLWTPPKTGSNHANFVFEHFDFASVVYREKDGHVVLNHNQNTLVHSHQYRIFPQHSNYKIICTARNPFSRLYSLYNNMVELNQFYNYDFQNFKHFVMNQRDPADERYQDIQYILDNVFKEILGNRIPDYFLRLENLYEDYLKIPFISGSSLNTSGILEEICQKKIHVRLTNLNLADHVDQELQDFITTKYAYYFDLLGYPKTIPITT